MNISRTSLIGVVGMADLGQSYGGFIAGNIDQAKQALASGRYQRVRSGYGIPGCDQAGCAFDPANTKALYLLGNCTDCSAPAPWAPTGNGGYAWGGSGSPPYPGIQVSSSISVSSAPPTSSGGFSISGGSLPISSFDGGTSGPLGGGSLLGPAQLRAPAPRRSSMLPVVIGVGILGVIAAAVVIKKRRHATV